MTEIDPNLPDWIKDHMRRYLETDGAEGHIWNGVPTLLLSTRGRRSGEWKTLPLIYGKAGNDHVVVADKFDARARTATGEEREALWQLMKGIFPQYEAYQAATEREIPVVVLEAKPR